MDTLPSPAPAREAPAGRGARKPRGQGPARRGEILAAAKRLFLELGYEQTTMRRIAAEVGVSATALYLYFPDKDAILVAIAEAFFEELLAVLTRATEEGPGDAVARFRAALRAYIAFGRARPDEYRLTFLAKMMAGTGPGRPEPPCPRLAPAERCFAVLEGGIAGLMQAGVFARRDTRLAAESVWAALHGATCLLLDLAEHVESGPDALIEAVLDLACRGLAAPA